jgi:sporulation protein YlmC with PRC-barrel domain
MFWNASVIKGYTIAATDGRLGTVSDFLFDDASWKIRWLVVDTGTWLSGRKVLLPPTVLRHPDANEREFSVALTMQQIKDSPDIDSDQPVSRQLETSVYDYYGWSPYWGMDLYMGGYGYAGGAMLASPYLESRWREETIPDTRQDDGDPHLRSIAAVTGYHIHASDGEIGHVRDFILEDADWSIHFLVVDTKNWWAGKTVLVSPHAAREISWHDRLVNLSVDRETVKSSPAYDATTTVDGAYEKRFHDHYGDVLATGQS